MAKRFGGLLFLTDQEAQSEALGVARIARALVGGAAILNELVSGVAVSDAPVTPPNPQGLIGMDLSGPPWGSAIRHPIAWIGGAKAATADAYGMSGAIAVDNTRPVQIGPWPVWVRPYERLPYPSIAPYSLGRLSFRGHIASAGAPVLSIVLENWSIAPASDSPTSVAETLTFNSMSEAAPSAGASPHLDLIPGWNDVFMTITSNSAIVTTIDSIVVNQIQKRTH